MILGNNTGWQNPVLTELSLELINTHTKRILASLNINTFIITIFVLAGKGSNTKSKITRAGHHPHTHCKRHQRM